MTLNSYYVIYVPVLFFKQDREIMDWDLAIKRNSEALKGIIEVLFVMLGLDGRATVSRIPWPAYRAVLRVLRPAESAVRRLIVVAARGLVVKLAPSRPNGRGAVKSEKGGTARSLLPALRSAATHRVARAGRNPKRAVPRIHFFTTDGEFITMGPPIRPAKAPARAKSADGLVNAARVIRRLQALEAALARSSPPGQAPGPLAEREEKSENPSFKSPLRPGHPPGYRRRPIHDVDELLVKCHWLAMGGDEARHKLKHKSVRIRIKLTTTYFCHPGERRDPDLTHA